MHKQIGRWMQISSGQGPAECEWVVGQVAKAFRSDAEQHGAVCRIIDRVPGKTNPPGTTGNRSDCFRSMLLEISGENVEQFCNEWQGTIQWIGQSLFRPKHRRKNWFVAIDSVTESSRIALEDLEKNVTVATFRAKGAGGQHVNKTSSAIRLTHRPTGVIVEAQEERSQHRNKQTAIKRLEMLLQRKNQEAEEQMNKRHRSKHQQLVRGNPRQVFVGQGFIKK